jgi:hypothetical protein
MCAELTPTAPVELGCIASGQVVGVGGRSLTPSFWEVSSAIHDAIYGLSWGLLIEVIETGERALIPYRWEQIGSKRQTSSQMQRRSSRGKRSEWRPASQPGRKGASSDSTQPRVRLLSTQDHHRKPHRCLTSPRAWMCRWGLERWSRHWSFFIRKPGPGAVSMSAAGTW